MRMDSDEILAALLIAIGVGFMALFYVSCGVLVAWGAGIPSWSAPWLACVFAWPVIIAVIFAIISFVSSIVGVIMASMVAGIAGVIALISERRP